VKRGEQGLGTGATGFGPAHAHNENANKPIGGTERFMMILHFLL
jgi:hypothetical protein